MVISKKYFELLSCANEIDLDVFLSRLSASDAKQILKTMVQFLHYQKIDQNDIIQFLQEQYFF